MNAETRRQKILAQLKVSSAPISAGRLAAELGVSRQIIVGDIALLRAYGESISATPRGYILSGGGEERLKRTVACCHRGEDMEKELNIMVDNGCTVRDVIVEHPIYGQITGNLELSSRYDVHEFARRSQEAEAVPLSYLTDGIHLHTLLCPDEETYERVCAQLKQAGFLFEE